MPVNDLIEVHIALDPLDFIGELAPASQDRCQRTSNQLHREMTSYAACCAFSAWRLSQIDLKIMIRATLSTSPTATAM